MKIKTFDEYYESKINEATISQWAKRSAAAGAAAGGLLGFAGLSAAGVASGGLALAIPLATWGGISMGMNGLLAGALFAGGQARKDFSELKKTMKRIQKYTQMDVNDVTPKTADKFQEDIKRAKLLTHKLRNSLNSDLDIGTSKGLLRTDIRQSEKFMKELDKLESELTAVEKKTAKAAKQIKQHKKK